MASALFLDALVGCDQKHGGVSAGRTGDHVFKKLLMTWGIDDHIGTLVGAKLDLRRINCDVLLLLLKQRIKKERVFKLHPFGFTCLANLIDLPFRQRIRIKENPSD